MIDLITGMSLKKMKKWLQENFDELSHERETE